MSQDDTSYHGRAKNQLDEHVEKASSHINKFRETHQTLWVFADVSIRFSHMIIECLMNQKLSFSEDCGLVFWDSVNRYLRNSFLHIIEKNLVVGIELLRISIELTKDISCICGNEKLLDILLNEDKEGNKYLDNFKFNTKSPQGEQLFNFYRFSLQFKIKAHQTEMDEIRKMNDNPHPDIEGSEESDFNLLHFVHYWFNACNTITSYLIESFLYRQEAEVREVFRIFYEFNALLNKNLNALTKVDLETIQMWLGEVDLPTIH